MVLDSWQRDVLEPVGRFGGWHLLTPREYAFIQPFKDPRSSFFASFKAHPCHGWPSVFPVQGRNSPEYTVPVISLLLPDRPPCR